MKKKAISLLLAMSLVMGLAVGCGSGKSEGDSSTASEESNAGDSITVAYEYVPESLDSDVTTVWQVSATMNHVYEGLFEFNAENEAVPQIAESYTVSDDGLEYDFVIRQGVKFHDGKEMTAEDVVASFNRWLNTNPAGASVIDIISSVEQVGDYEMKITFTSPYSAFLNLLASPVSCQKFVVREKEIVEKFGSDTITEHIGTGPYKLAEYVEGKSVKLVKFDDYAMKEEESSGFAGKREALIDEINIEFIEDPSVRIAGLESGQYQFIEDVAADRFEELESVDGVDPILCDYGTMGIVTFNCGNAPTNDVNIRRAIATCIDMEALATAQIGDEKFWSLNGCLFGEDTRWYDETAGEGVYNVHDIELAKEYVEKSNYNGEEIVILDTKESSIESAGALALQSQLKEIGLNVTVELVDSATLMEKRAQKEGWNIYVNEWSELNPDPQVFQPWTATDGWLINWDDEYSHDMDDIFNQMMVEVDQDKRVELVKEMYKKFWDYCPYLKTYSHKRIHGLSSNLKGYANFGQQFFWNCYLER